MRANTSAEPVATGVLPLPPCPEDVFSPEGAPRAGVYRGAPREVGFHRWASTLTRALRQKRWQYVAIVSPDLIAAAAIVHLGYAGLAFATAWDRKAKRFFEVESLVPLAVGVLADGTPEDGVHAYRGPRGSLRMAAGASGRTLTADLRGPAGERLVIDVEMPCAGETLDTLTCVSWLRPSGLNVTSKAAGLPVRGLLSIGGQAHPLDGAVAIVDWTQGFPAYRTAWNWATGAGRSTSNRTVGFNVSVGYNDAHETENAVWIDGRLHRIGPVRFDLPTGDGLAPWHVATADGGLDLTFQPEAMRAAADDFLLIASRYRQPVGTFRGHVPDGAGGTLELDGLPGVAEDHLARW